MKSKTQIKTRKRIRDEKEEGKANTEEETLLPLFLSEVVDSDHVLDDVIKFVMPTNLYS